MVLSRSGSSGSFGVVLPSEVSKKLRIFRTFDTTAFCNELLNSGLRYISDIGLDLYVNVFNTTIRTTLDKFAPWKTVKCSKRDDQPFYSRELRAQKRIKSRLESRRRRNKTRENFVAYKNQVERFAVLLRDSKRSYYRSLVNKNAKSSKKLWCILNKVISNRDAKVLPTSSSESNLT